MLHIYSHLFSNSILSLGAQNVHTTINLVFCNLFDWTLSTQQFLFILLHVKFPPLFFRKQTFLDSSKFSTNLSIFPTAAHRYERNLFFSICERNMLRFGYEFSDFREVSFENEIILQDGALVKKEKES